MPQRTPEGKWRIYHRKTGEALDRWPIDARGLLEGDYVAEVPEGAEPLPPLTPEQRGIVEGPGEPSVPGLAAERESRKGTLKEAPPDAQKAEEAPPPEPLQPPTRSSGSAGRASRKKKG